MSQESSNPVNAATDAVVQSESWRLVSKVIECIVGNSFESLRERCDKAGVPLRSILEMADNPDGVTTGQLVQLTQRAGLELSIYAMAPQTR